MWICQAVNSPWPSSSFWDRSFSVVVLVKVLQRHFFLAHHCVKLGLSVKHLYKHGCNRLNRYKTRFSRLKKCMKANSNDGKWCCCLEMLKGKVPHVKMLPAHLGDKPDCSTNAEAVRTDQVLLPLLFAPGCCVFLQSSNLGLGSLQVVESPGWGNCFAINVVSLINDFCLYH